MIINIFNQGKSNGTNHINYLFDELKHKGFKPELFKGNRDITENICNSITNKNKYISGVIAFRDNEKLDKKSLFNITEIFEKTVAPIETGRVNFLWVLHQDKGNTELHFISPRIDLKTNKALNIHPPGKTNLLMYEHLTRVLNYSYGFNQVDNKDYKKSNYDFSKKLLNDLTTKRKEYFKNQYCKSKLNVYTKRKEVKNKKNEYTNRTEIRTSINDNPIKFKNFIGINRIIIDNTIAAIKTSDFDRANINENRSSWNDVIINDTTQSVNVKSYANKREVIKSGQFKQIKNIDLSLSIQLNELYISYEKELDIVKKYKILFRISVLIAKINAESQKNIDEYYKQFNNKLKI